MAYEYWKDRIEEFEKIDVRGIQGIGYFSSEIGLFAAYKTTKKMEKQGKNRAEIAELLKEKFGEKNPDVKV